MIKDIRTYDNEFKTQAVLLYLNSGKTYPLLSKELGVPASTLAEGKELLYLKRFIGVKK